MSSSQANGQTSARTNYLKAGFLNRRSRWLHKWKTNWVALEANGQLKYYESSNSVHPEETVFMKTECKSVVVGANCDFDPAPGFTKECCFEVTTTDDRSYKFCCRTPDECLAWTLSLDESRVIEPPNVTATRHSQSYQAPPDYQAVTGTPPPYTPTPMAAAGYPQQTYRVVGPNQPVYSYEGPGGAVHYVYPPNGQTVVMCDGHRHRRRCCDGDGMATGMIAGAALGTMMWSPWLWW